MGCPSQSSVAACPWLLPCCLGGCLGVSFVTHRRWWSLELMPHDATGTPVKAMALTAAVAVMSNDVFHRQLMDGCSISVWMFSSLAALVIMSFLLGAVLSSITARAEKKVKRV